MEDPEVGASYFIFLFPLVFKMLFSGFLSTVLLHISVNTKLPFICVFILLTCLLWLNYLLLLFPSGSRDSKLIASLVLSLKLFPIPNFTQEGVKHTGTCMHINNNFSLSSSLIQPDIVADVHHRFIWATTCFKKRTGKRNGKWIGSAQIIRTIQLPLTTCDWRSCLPSVMDNSQNSLWPIDVGFEFL